MTALAPLFGLTLLVAGAAAGNPLTVETALHRTAPTLPETAPPSIGAKESTHRTVVEDPELGTIEVKLKLASRGANRINNEPRLDLAAYEIQKLFLDPEAFIVPPTVLRAMSLEDARRFTPRIRPTFSNGDSVLVIVQAWLQGVDRPGQLPAPGHDPSFLTALARFNLFTYLIQHGDSNRGNFLVSKAPDAPHVFSVDNDISFGRSADERGPSWRKLHVDALPGSSIERLRQLENDDLHRRLGVLVEFEIVDGLLTRTAPGQNLGPKRGIRIRGDRVQLGLTHREIEKLIDRIDRLLERVDQGEFTLY